MMDNLAARSKRTRSITSWSAPAVLQHLMTIACMLVYYGYILLIALTRNGWEPSWPPDDHLDRYSGSVSGS